MFFTTLDSSHIPYMIRHAVYVKENNWIPTPSYITCEAESDELDPFATHFVTRRGGSDSDTGTPVGTARVLDRRYSRLQVEQFIAVETDALEVSRLCILPEYRKTDALRNLTRTMIDYLLVRRPGVPIYVAMPGALFTHVEHTAGITFDIVLRGAALHGTRDIGRVVLGE